jgi:hypothetical protein
VGFLGLPGFFRKKIFLGILVDFSWKLIGKYPEKISLEFPVFLKRNLKKTQGFAKTFYLSKKYYGDDTLLQNSGGKSGNWWKSMEINGNIKFTWDFPR